MTRPLFYRIITVFAASVALLALVGSTLHAAEDAPKQPPRIVFPHVEPQPKPAPLPKPDPDDVPKVAIGELYVITSTVPFRAAVSPEDYAHTSEAKGPVQINAVFHGGSGKREWKTFTGYVLVVDPQVKDVRIEILLAFNGEERPGEFVRQLIDIGVGPRPPPDPEPDPRPEPTPTAKTLGIVNIDIANKRATNLPLARLLTDIAYWDTLRAAGHKVWLMDKSNAQARQYDDLAAKVGYPLTVFYDGAVTPPKMIGSVRTPNDKAGFDALVKQFSGK